MTRVAVLLAVIVIALSAGLLAQTQTQASPEVLLKAAMQKEQVDGDLPGAMAQYKAIVEQFPKDPAAPKALLQMAGIYERLGRPEAREAYYTIILKYADRDDVARVARDRLAELTGRGRGPSATEIPVPPEAADLGGAVSPDGRFISFVDDTFVAQEGGNGQGNLGIWDLATGLTRLVTHSSGWDEGNARSSIWSPDSRQIAYVWWNNRDDRYEIRVVDRGGGTPRTVYSDEGGAGLILCSWSPDGSVVAVVRQATPLAARVRAGSPRAEIDLALLSVTDGTPRVLMTFPTVRVPQRATFSPDGLHLVYDWPADEASASRDIFLADISNGAARALVADPASNDIVLGWSPDGLHLLYAADHAATREIRAVTVVDGQPSLEPAVLKRGVGDSTPLGFTRDGRLFVQQYLGGADIMTMPLDPETGAAAAAASLPPSQPGVWREHPTWSPDSTRLAYLQSGSNSDYMLVVQTLETGAKRSYPVPLGGGPERIVWEPDERAVILRGNDGNGRNGMHRIDLEDGAMTFMSRGHTGLFSPDGQYYYYPTPPGHPTGGGIVRRTLADGTEQSVDRGRHRSVTLSPDGRLLALFDPGSGERDSPSIAVAPAGGGQRRTLVRGFLEMDGELDFSADSRYVYFTTVRPARKIWRVAVAGGEPELVANSEREIKHLSASRDGRSLAIGVVGSDPEVSVWENLLPTRGGGR